MSPGASPFFCAASSRPMQQQKKPVLTTEALLGKSTQVDAAADELFRARYLLDSSASTAVG